MEVVTTGAVLWIAGLAFSSICLVGFVCLAGGWLWGRASAAREEAVSHLLVDAILDETAQGRDVALVAISDAYDRRFLDHPAILRLADRYAVKEASDRTPPLADRDIGPRHPAIAEPELELEDEDAGSAP